MLKVMLILFRRLLSNKHAFTAILALVVLASSCKPRVLEPPISEKKKSVESWSFYWNDPDVRAPQTNTPERTTAQERISKGIRAILDRNAREFKSIFGISNTRPLLIKVIENSEFIKTIDGSDRVNAMFTGGALIINLRNDLNWRSLRRSLRHEMVHVMIADSSGGLVPAWLDEGLAVYWEGGVAEEKVEAFRRMVRSTRNYRFKDYKESFTLLPIEEQSFAYIQSYYAAKSLIQTNGLTQLKRLLKSNDSEQSFARAFKNLTGESIQEFAQRMSKQLNLWSICNSCPL